jgi:hypothetical protein
VEAEITRRGWTLERVGAAAYGCTQGGWRARKGGITRGGYRLEHVVEQVREHEAWEAERMQQYILNEIITGDARALAPSIPDASVDLVFTDPEYSRRELYDWLGGAARRVLKPGGAVLCWSNGKWHRENTNWLEAAGLRYRYDFGCVIATGAAPMNGRIISKTNRLIWLDVDGQSRMRGYLPDGYISVQWSRLYSQWSWTKNPVFSGQAMAAFIEPGAIVYDPFCGEATFPAVAKMGGYSFLASEINPETAARARERLANTQPPLPGLVVEQAGFDLSAA